MKWTFSFICYTGAQIEVNHELTELIPVTSDICQGCPLSTLLFALAADLTTKKNTGCPFHLWARAWVASNQITAVCG